MNEDQFLMDLLDMEADEPAVTPAVLANPIADQFPTLYHSGKEGDITQWRVWTEGDTIYSEYGLMKGKKQTSTKIATPKNVGRANETNGHQQALIEAQAMWTKRVERKYRTDINAAQETIYLPMTAHKLSEKRHLVKYPATIQPKFNGLRCTASWKDGQICLTSRGGKPYTAPQHIIQQLQLFIPKTAKLDGELYRHGSTLQSLNSWVKKKGPHTHKVEYHIYDVPQWDGIEDLTWRERWDCLPTLETLRPAAATNIFFSETYEVQSEAEAKQYQKDFVSRGYEGGMLRTYEGLYLWGHQSSDLLKIKDFQDAEFVVVGFHGGDPGTKEEFCVVWECETADGKRFSARPRGSLASRQAYMKKAQDYIGEKLTVRYFDITPDGVPFNPVGLVFRLKEDLPE